VAASFMAGGCRGENFGNYDYILQLSNTVETAPYAAARNKVLPPIRHGELQGMQFLVCVEGRYEQRSVAFHAFDRE
jgi:hypothetical protein